MTANPLITRRSLLALAALGATSLVLGGCSSEPAASSASSSASSANSSNSSAASASSSQAAADTGMDLSGRRVLVAYFSATGNTAAVADVITQATGADAFVITPAAPYTSDDLNWRADGSRVNREHEDESLRDIELAQVTPDNFADYDTVFLGYPIWWGIAAWPINRFVTENDFAGKTVIPFCTSTSSGLGDSAALLQAAAGTGTWEQGRRFASNASASDVEEWLGELDLSASN